MRFIRKNKEVNKNLNIEAKLNSETIVKMLKTMEHRPNPAANELSVRKRTLSIIELIKLKAMEFRRVHSPPKNPVDSRSRTDRLILGHTNYSRSVRESQKLAGFPIEAGGTLTPIASTIQTRASYRDLASDKKPKNAVGSNESRNSYILLSSLRKSSNSRSTSA